jgi:8-hydroxy-5-deazaflavin:NADPH oxidoreductase
VRIGIVGSGHIGGTAARLFEAAGHEVEVSNSRGDPHTAEEAAQFGELILVAIPLHAVGSLPAKPFAGKVVVDANNYYPGRDGQIAEIDGGKASSRWVADHHPGATVVKAFNTINYRKLLADGRPHGDPERIAIPVAADDEEAKATVSDLVDALGFDPVDSGSLDASRHQEPGTPVYGADLGAAEARAALG